MKLLPASMDSPKARVLLLAIGLQESRFEYTKQIKGPAKSYWQFESGGGVKGVMTHPASKHHARKVCEALGIPFLQPIIYNAFEFNQVLAAAFSRLLLYTDAKALPQLGDAERAWQYYIWNWRPGKPHRKTWDSLYQKALEFVKKEYKV